MELTVAEKSLLLAMPEGNEIAYDGLKNGTMKELISGMALQAERDRLGSVQIMKDFFPGTTNLIEEWEDFFKLTSGRFLTETQRRNRLIASWQHISPGSFTGMNRIYELSDLPVFCRPLRPDEDPRVLATSDERQRIYIAVCGEESVCGEDLICGDYYITPVTPEVRVFTDGRMGDIVRNYTCQVGEALICGEDLICGDYQGYNILDTKPTIPDDTKYWPLIYVIEDKSGNFAQVPMELKEMYDYLTLKIKPYCMWAISRVEFV